MDETRGNRASAFVVGLLLLLLVVGAYLAGRWSALEKLRQAQAETDRFRMLSETEQGLRQRAEQERDQIRAFKSPEPPAWILRVQELLQRKWDEHHRDFADERE